MQKFDLATRKTDKVLERVSGFELSASGEKMLYRQGEKWFLTAAAAPAKPGDGLLKTEELEVKVDPRAEWRQMYREVWRIQRDFLYDPNVMNLMFLTAQCEPFLGRKQPVSDAVQLTEIESMQKWEALFPVDLATCCPDSRA